MLLNDRIQAFSEVGRFLNQFKTTGPKKDNAVMYNSDFFDEMQHKISSLEHYNGWFTTENVLFSIEQWANALSEKNLKQWISRYDLSTTISKNIGIIMAGNIPLVGFHDFLSVLISGHKVSVKLSSNDNLLLPFIASYLIEIEPRFKEYITFTKDQLKEFDAIIATGSNNTARYFEYYFGKVPNIIRKNRNSVAILTGNETKEQLEALGEDIFTYFGLGCRSVSKLYVPENYDFTLFFEAMYTFNDVIHIAKYANNYDYNKAVYLMSNFKLLENGFLILKEDQSFSSPIGTLFYETYTSLPSLYENLKDNTENIQCIASELSEEFSVNFGETQKPKLWDYADGIDIIQFLTQNI